MINKDKRHPEEILLINASHLFSKGDPKNYLEEEELSTIIGSDEISENDFNLSPSRYVSQNVGEEVLPLEDAVVLLEEAEEERAKVDEELNKVLKERGVLVWPK
ncbi:MAG TPA: hypothetical protein VK112_07055 [Fodinibius sp.]|nr:hypothetical protein [Fodinibius sp.]